MFCDVIKQHQSKSLQLPFSLHLCIFAAEMSETLLSVDIGQYHSWKKGVGKHQQIAKSWIDNNITIWGMKLPKVNFNTICSIQFALYSTIIETSPHVGQRCSVQFQLPSCTVLFITWQKIFFFFFFFENERIILSENDATSKLWSSFPGSKTSLFHVWLVVFFLSQVENVALILCDKVLNCGKR